METNSTRPGFSNVSIKLFEDYDAWLDNRFIEFAGTFVSLNTRDGLSEGSSGLFQVYDTRNLHTKINGREIIQISFRGFRGKSTHNRIYGIKNTSVSVDNKGDNIITFEIGPIHKVRNDKFSRSFFPDAVDTIEEMLRVIYLDEPLLIPKVIGIPTHVPKVPWMFTMEKYKEFIREHGLSTDANSFTFVWEDFEGIKISDYDTLIQQEPVDFVFGDPKRIGEFLNQLEHPLAFNFEWLTKNNPYVRDPYQNATYIAYSTLDKGLPKIVSGDGRNSVVVSRSGGYASQLYRNPYEEATKIQIMSQYDGYARFTVFGEFEIFPGMKIRLGDTKSQFLGDFYVDTVVHEVTMNQSKTHVYVFTNSMILEEIENEKIKNTLDGQPQE